MGAMNRWHTHSFCTNPRIKTVEVERDKHRVNSHLGYCDDHADKVLLQSVTPIPHVKPDALCLLHNAPAHLEGMTGSLSMEFYTSIHMYLHVPPPKRVRLQAHTQKDQKI